MRTRAGTEARVNLCVEGRESLGTYEVMIEVVQETREEGRRQRATSSHSHKKIRHPSDTVATCKESERRDGRRGAGPGRAEEERKSEKKTEEL